MKKITRIMLLIAILTGQMFVSFADRGVGRKKNKIVLNIRTGGNFSSNLNFNLRNGMKYTGSLLNMPVSAANLQNTLITYQKGNSVYILPYKQKVFVADSRRGFAGTKLIIRVP